MIALGNAPRPGRSEAAHAEPIAAGLIGVQTRFRALIVDRLLVFEALKKDIEANRHQAQALGKIADLAHKIAGVAATLGYPRVGGLAADIELAVRNGDAAATSSHQTWRGVQPVLEALLDELEILLDD